MPDFKSWRKSKAYKITNRTVGLALLLWVSVIISPKLLAFPHHAQIGDTLIWSEAPIAPRMKDILARSDALLRRSAIFSKGYGKSIYLTSGGWRWKLLTVQSSNGFAISRAFTENIIINQSDIGKDKVFSSAAEGRTRTLADTIAHERTHGLLRSRFGATIDFTAPVWKREGYCDYVAQASSLNDAQALEMERSRPDHPALPYYHGRKRVTAILTDNGGSVDKLFQD